MVVVHGANIDRLSALESPPEDVYEAKDILDPITHRRLLARRSWQRSISTAGFSARSHASSGPLAVVALAPTPCGVDLETSLRWPLAATALRRNNPEQAAWIWVRLEAILKATGRGLRDGIPADLVAQLELGHPLVPWAGRKFRITPFALSDAIGAVAADEWLPVTWCGPDFLV